MNNAALQKLISLTQELSDIHAELARIQRDYEERHNAAIQRLNLVSGKVSALAHILKGVASCHQLPRNP